MGTSSERVTRTATLLFTDLVGSSAMTIRLGPEADALRRAHFSLLRGAVTEAGGDEVKSLGDGLMVVFDSATGAVSCAAAMQRAVERRNRQQSEPLLVRIGVSLGDVTVEADDYFGVPVIEAARLCAAAGAGQILISGVVRAIARAGPGQRFTEVGPLELHGFDTPVAAWEVEWQPAECGAETTLPIALRRSLSTGWFVGRERFLDELSAGWRRTLAGERRATLIAGEPGLGKTRLVAEHARRACADNPVVLYGRCEADLGAPFAPFVTALRQLIEVADADLLGEHVARYGGEITRLVPEIRERVPGTPAPSTAEPETELYRLVTAVVALFDAISARQPVLLVIEDIHWADRPSLRLMLSLMQGVDAPLALLATYRDVTADQSPALRDALGEMARESRIQRLQLQGLDDRETVKLLEAIVGQAVGNTGTAIARSLCRETAGNALFTTELVRDLVESGVVSHDGNGWRLNGDVEDLAVPDTVRDVIAARVHRLGDTAVSVLRVAAIVGRDFEFELLSRVTREPEDVLLDVLDAAHEAALVDESRDSPGQFWFTHALVAHALAGELGGRHRREVHRRIARAMESIVEVEPDRTGELARHLLAAGDIGRGYEIAMKAGDLALAALAPDEAARWYLRALQAEDAGVAGDEARRCEALIRLGDAERRGGLAGWGEHLAAAAEIAGRREDAERLARAALANNRGMFTNQSSPDRERVAMLEAALDAVGPTDSPGRARLLATLASELWSGDHDRRVTLSHEALAIARRIGDAHLLGDVAYRHCLNVAEPSTLGERLALTSELLDLAERADDPVLGCLASAERGRVAIEAGDLAEGLRHAERQRDLARVSGNAYARHIAAWSAGWPLTLRGEYEQAEQAANAALTESTGSGQPDAMAIYSSQLFVIRREQGRLDEFADALLTLAAAADAVPAMRAHAALALVEVGRGEEAATLVAEAATGDFGMRVDAIWLTGNVVWGEACARVGHAPGARVLLERLVPWREQIAFTGFSVYGAVARVAALLAATVGDERCGDLFREAEQRHLALRAPCLLAQTRLDWGSWLLEQPDSADDAGRLLRLAHEDATAHGCGAIQGRAGSLLDPLSRAGPRGTARR